MIFLTAAVSFLPLCNKEKNNILHYFLDKTDISRHFCVALWWDYYNNY